VTFFDVLLLLLVAAICGGVAQAIAGYSAGGCLVSIALGFVGALIGLLLARLVNLPDVLTLQLGEVRFPVVWSIVGATLFVLLVALVRRRPGGNP
jgi:uncharacterized membrane protein YeaQ/YmgE (transglycosylase-associated protein family)